MTPSPRPPIHPGQLATRIARVAREVQAGHSVLALTRARLCDGFRDAGVPPLKPPPFDGLATQLDPDGLDRLELAVRVLLAPELRDGFRDAARARGAPDVFDRVVAHVARDQAGTSLRRLVADPGACRELAEVFLRVLGARAGPAPDPRITALRTLLGGDGSLPGP